MNPLVEDFPLALCGIPIDTDYRRMVQFELLMQNAEIPMQEKLPLALQLVYLQPVPDLQEAWDRLLWYYRCGQPLQTAQNQLAQPRRMYDFEQDSQRIYTAFLQEYGIDLQSQPLHWWKFYTLLVNLPEDCPMGKIMYYRTVNPANLKGEERKQAMAMQARFALDKPAIVPPEQRDKEFLERIRQRREQLQRQLGDKGGEK